VENIYKQNGLYCSIFVYIHSKQLLSTAGDSSCLESLIAIQKLIFVTAERSNTRHRCRKTQKA
ncbi:MAG: hypothetical protein LBT21_08125, partial [Oscillospiraceae bacterium]|nr:hypothetical protein [Oscillospiraceae bacterium]